MKTILVLLALSLSFSAMARDERGSIELRDGKTILRIDVGNERDQDSRAMARRIVNLERAVRELQNRVYDLEEDTRPVYSREVVVHVCALKTSFNGTFIGKASSETESRASVVQKCKNGGAAFCESTPINCERTVEIVRN